MKRTADGRIIEKRVKVDKKLLGKLLLEIRMKYAITWSYLASKLNISTQTLRHGWFKKDSTIPISLFKIILHMLGKSTDKHILKQMKIIEPFWGQKLANGKDKSKRIKLPSLESEELAEFYGIMLGDGCLFSNLKGLSITADRILEYEYFTSHLNKLIYKLFGLYPKFYFTRNTRTMRCVLYSKKVVNYLSKLGFPLGFKKDLIFPQFIQQKNKSVLKGLRGLMDTDGSLSAHPHSKIMIHLSITDPLLRNQVYNFLIKFRIKPGLFNKGIMIYGPNAIKFCEVIGFSNLKNKLKYEFFLKNGKVPRSKEVEKFIRGDCS